MSAGESYRWRNVNYLTSGRSCGIDEKKKISLQDKSLREWEEQLTIALKPRTWRKVTVCCDKPHNPVSLKSLVMVSLGSEMMSKCPRHTDSSPRKERKTWMTKELWVLCKDAESSKHKKRLEGRVKKSLVDKIKRIYELGSSKVMKLKQ